MSRSSSRPYNAPSRREAAIQTKKRILLCARDLFTLEGFAKTTIEKIAKQANVSIPTIYGLFQSKKGILQAIMDSALPKNTFEELVHKSHSALSPEERLSFSAKIARNIYDAEKDQIQILLGATVIAPEFKELEQEREKRRYSRQEKTITTMVKEKSLSKRLTPKKARDLLWTFTGRDLYRMLVIEQKWTSNDYEQWLSQLLIDALIEKA